VADPGEGPRGAAIPPPLFLHQTKALPLFSKGQDDRPPSPPYLKVWIRHSIKYTTVHNTKRKKEKKKRRKVKK